MFGKIGKWVWPGYDKYQTITEGADQTNIRSDHSEIVDDRERVLVTTEPALTGAPLPQNVAVPVAAAPVITGYAAGTASVRTSRSSGFTPSALVAGLVSVILLVLGGIAVARAGFDGSFGDPVVTVGGYTATALLGLIEIGFGIVLLAAALTRSREALLFLGIVGGVAALVAVFQPSVGEGSLAIEPGFAAVGALMMVAIVVTALLPTVMRNSVTQRTSDVP